MAEDVAEGFFSFSPPMLRQFTPADIKIILVNLALATRQLRQEKIPLEDVMALKARNMKLSRLNHAETIIRTYCKKRRIPC